MRFILVMLMLVFASVVSAQQPAKVAIVEVKHAAPSASAPRECLADGSWKLDDIYTFRGEFVQAESLNQYFREKK